jgi:D-alanine-D-alanine ligase
MKITVLTYVERENTRNYDAVVRQVASALRSLKHAVSVVGIHGDVRKLLNRLLRRPPDLIFNLMEMFGSNLFGDCAAVGLLDLLNIPYTGGGPGEIYLQQDKSLTKKLLAYEQILYPEFAVFSREAGLETGGHLRMPLFVKPLRADASLGIDAGSLVDNATALMKRVKAIQDKVHDAALAEEYIEGREFYVGVLGNQHPEALPPIEIDFTGFPKGKPRVLDGRAKWDKNTAEYRGTQARVAEVPEELYARLQKVAISAYRALRVRDYGRIDLRLTPTNEIYVLEVNANCYLEQSGEFAIAAAAAGLDYAALIKRIIELALKRCRVTSAA